MARLAASSPSRLSRRVRRSQAARGTGVARGTAGVVSPACTDAVRCSSERRRSRGVGPDRGCPRATPKRRVQWRCRSVGGAGPGVVAGRPGRRLRRLAPSRPAVRRQRKPAAQAMGSDPSNTCVSTSPLPMISMATCRGRRCRARGRGRRWRCRDGRYSALAVAAWSCWRLRRVAVVSAVLAARPLGAFGTAVLLGSGVCSAARRAGAAVLRCCEPLRAGCGPSRVTGRREARVEGGRDDASRRLETDKSVSGPRRQASGRQVLERLSDRFP